MGRWSSEYWCGRAIGGEGSSALGSRAGGFFILIIHLDKYIRMDKIMAVFQAVLVYTGCELALLIDGRSRPERQSRRLPALTLLGLWLIFWVHKYSFTSWQGWRCCFGQTSWTVLIVFVRWKYYLSFLGNYQEIAAPENKLRQMFSLHSISEWFN